MSVPSLKNKNKDDLAVIAHVSGLLTPVETSRMTKQQLLAFLLDVSAGGEQAVDEAAASAAAEPAAEEKPKRRGRPRKTKTADVTPEDEAASDADVKSAGEADVSEPAAKKKAAPKRRARTAKTEAPEAEKPAAQAADEPSDEDAAAKDKAGRAEAKAAPEAAPEVTAPVEDTAEKADTAKKTDAAKKTEAVKKADAAKKTAAARKKDGAKRADEAGEETKKRARTAPARKNHRQDEPDADAETAETKLAAAAAAPETARVSGEKDEAASDAEAADRRESETAEAEVRPAADAAAPEAAAGPSAPAEVKAEPAKRDADVVSGILEIMPDGYGFLRIENYLQGNHDIYVPPQYIRRFGLRSGDLVTGPCRQQREADRYRALYYIKEVNGQTPDKMIRRPHFDRLTPIYPNERFTLETTRNELSTRIIDLVSPIGKGQRGMIVSPPKAGKTILLQKIANAISINNPDAKLIVLLIDERPEEVTDMQRSINGEVVYSTFDKTPENHVKVTELVLERAMRLVELKQDVVILLDSITRMGRAYNLTITPTGRTLSGGLDPGALYGPKRFFGAARNIEHGGSLTIIATALIETGSRMDEVIFEEFKGTGNMEVLLDRKLSEKRIFPAIDITRSGTRREELLLSKRELDSVWAIRKAFGQLDTAAVTETIINLLLKTRNNQQFIQSINVSFNDKALYDAMRGGMKPNGANGNQGGAHDR